VNVKKLYLGLR